MNRKLLLLALIVLICACTVSQVSATADSDYGANEIETGLMVDLEDVEESSTESPDSTIHYINSGSDIQEAINQANESDTIVLNGTFELKKTVDIDKAITIIGDGDGSIITQSSFSASIFRYFNVNANASNVVLNNLIFKNGLNNFAGAIYWQGSNGNINNCEFISNVVQDTNGGAVVLTGSNCNVTNCTFNKNQANGQGGALYITGNGCRVIGCNFTQNCVKQKGGAIYLSGENCIVSECDFNKNYASQYAGAIALDGKKNRISLSRFNENYVLNSINDSSSAGGGALFSSCVNVEINNCSFKSNYIRNANGGAIGLTESGTISNSYFKDNSAVYGKDIFTNASQTIVKSNYFVLDYNETKETAVNTTEYLWPDNVFNITKPVSSVEFNASMVFDYGASGSIRVIVEGGYIDEQNITVLNHTEAVIKFSNDVLTVSGLDVGNYTLRVTTSPDVNHTSTDKDLSITVRKATAVISVSKTQLTVALKGSSVWSIKLINSKTNKPISGMKLTLKVYTGNKYKIVTVTTNTKGIATFKTYSLTTGTHKIEVTGNHAGYNFNKVVSSIKVIKPTELKYTLVKRQSGSGGALLSYIVSNKKTGKGINGVKIKCLIYTGKKYKTYYLTTKKIKGKKVYNGAVGFSTNDFSAGKHIVKLMPSNIKYKGTVKTYIVIKKSATKKLKFFRKV